MNMSIYMEYRNKYNQINTLVSLLYHYPKYLVCEKSYIYDFFIKI